MSSGEEPQKSGWFGRFGGRYVAEALWTPLEQLAEAFDSSLLDVEFIASFESWLDHRIGRPTPLSHFKTLSERLGGAQIWAKREDLCQGGSFVITSAVLQVMLAKRMGCTEVVAESGTGDFGAALGSVGAGLGIGVRVFMGREDQEHERLNIERMKKLGVVIETVDSSMRGRKRSCSEALRYWAEHSERVLYCASSLAMPDPYPRILEYGLRAIGAETRVQLKRQGCVPEYVIAPVGSGSFAAGIFVDFVNHSDIQLVGVEAGGDGQRNSASLVHGSPGVFQGTMSYLLQDSNGQITVPYSIAGGMCVPNAGPQHADWAERGRVHYVSVTDEDACQAVQLLARTEGLLICLEAGHALAYALKVAATLGSDEHVVIGITGSGERDFDRRWPHGAEGGGHE